MPVEIYPSYTEPYAELSFKVRSSGERVLKRFHLYGGGLCIQGEIRFRHDHGYRTENEEDTRARSTSAGSGHRGGL